MQAKKLLLSSAIVAAAGLLTATAAMAWDDHSCSSCSTFAPVIVIAEGPCPVDMTNPASPICTAVSDYTGIRYRNTGSLADNLATLVTVNNTVSVGTGNQVYGACIGDPLTKLGKYSCHELAVKINPANQQTSGFWIVAKGTVGNGQRQPILTSVAAKKGDCIKSFPILGLGLDSPVSPFQALKKTETVVFKGCPVTFEFDSAGHIVSAFDGEPEPGATCSGVVTSTVDQLRLTLGDLDLGLGQLGEGYLSTGSHSCTTRVSFGKVYTWGSPCP